MGLAHLKPFQPCFVVADVEASSHKIYTKHPALRGRDYTSASALCESYAERNALRKRFIRKWEKEQILRVNKTVDLSAHGGLSQGQKAPR